jgi:hypothetical protein
MLSRSGDQRALRAAVLALLGLLVGGCSHLHWPWHHAPPPPPVPVHEVDIAGAGLESAPQYWKRNTLLIDISAARGSGSFTVKPIAGTTWPVRVALRVTPGAIVVLEVVGAQRLRLPITPSGAAPIDLELPPGLYAGKTPELTVRFGTQPP